jgi:hypothetical protein
MSILARARDHVRPALILDVVGLALLALALVATLGYAAIPVGFDDGGHYDEGILITNAKLIGWHFVPYRDFYSNYPPGIFVTIALIWKVFGVGVRPERLFGLALHLAIAVGVGRAAGRLSRRRFSLFSAGVMLAFLAPDRCVAYAWLAAVACLLLFCELLARCLDGDNVPPASAYRAVAAGLVLALISWYRHDVFIYYAATLTLALAALWLRTRTLPSLRWPWLVAAVAVTLAILWLPIFARAGVQQVANDLYFDQVRYVLPARKQPLPPLFAYHERLFPAFIGQFFECAVLLVLAGPLLTLWPLWRWRDDARLRWLGLPICAASVALLPQAMGRTDIPHVIGSLPPALAGLGALIESLLAARRGWLWHAPLALGLALMAFLVAPLVMPLAHVHRPPALVEPGLSDERRQLIAFVQAHTRPGEPIYHGYRQHQRLLINEVDLYYYLDRPGATRYLQFDPNVINRADVQQHMIEELEQKKVRLLVLAVEGGVWFEPNESRRVGADVLDKWLRANFTPVARFGNYEVDLRN